MAEVEKRVEKEDEIDLIELFKAIWSGKWVILKVTSLFILFGAVIAFTTPEEYETSATLIPEVLNQGGDLGNSSLGGLASLAGVNLGSLKGSTSGINPALYQSVSRSTPFLFELLNSNFYFHTLQDSTTLLDYFQNHARSSLIGKTISLPYLVLDWIKGSSDQNVKREFITNLISLSVEEQKLIENLKERIFVEMDWELNTLKIQVQLQDPIATAQVAEFTKDYITAYVTEYATSKTKQQLESVEIQYDERKAKFETAQIALAEFIDQNLNVTSAKAKSEEERLRTEYNLAFNIFNQVAQQREGIQLKIQEKTPVFTVLEPIKIPNKKYKPKRVVMILGFLLLGFLLAVVIALVKSKVGEVNEL